VQHSKATVDLLRTAQDGLKGSGACWPLLLPPLLPLLLLLLLLLLPSPSPEREHSNADRQHLLRSFQWSRVSPCCCVQVAAATRRCSMQ
jgi:hypothetical protein